MKVLLTGAAGRLGSNVYRQLVASGLDVRATDAHYAANLPGPLDMANLLDPLVCYRLLDGVEAVVHLANHPSYHGRDGQRIFNENVSMNMNVFEAARQVGVKRIVFASSIQAMSGYRPMPVDQALPPSALPYLPLDGEVPANPGNPYALSKQASEVMLRYYAQQAGISCVALRFPHLATDDVRDFITSRSSDMVRPGHNLDEAFTVLRHTDAARLIDAILRTDLPGFRIYFPTDPAPTMNLPVADIIRRYFGNVPLRQPLDQIKSIVDISRIERETGWRPAPAPSSPAPR